MSEQLPALCTCGGYMRPRFDATTVVDGVKTTITCVQCERCQRQYSLTTSKRTHPKDPHHAD